jgi:rhamnosyltransferase
MGHLAPPNGDGMPEISVALERTVVIIPTLNASAHIPGILAGLALQPIRPNQILVIDSESTDDTRDQFSAYGAHVATVTRKSFNHGGTRARAIAMCPDAEIFILMTHDAVPVNDRTFSALIAAFSDPKVGMAYGRQLHRPGAKGVERFSRLFNYPPQSQRRTLADAAIYGVKTTFCSNSFAAYRRTAYEEVGGFPDDAFFAEDQITAGKMLLAGWTMAYVAEAEVFHSHAYSIREDFNRYFDVGVFHARNAWLKDRFGSAEGEGFRFLRKELGYLMRSDPFALPSAVARTFTKYAGYRLGKFEERLPSALKARLSMQPFYWRA